MHTPTLPKACIKGWSEEQHEDIYSHTYIHTHTHIQICWNTIFEGNKNKLIQENVSFKYFFTIMSLKFVYTCVNK